MRTDASAKFEKNIDPMMTLEAVNRACELVELLGAGEVLDGVIDILNDIPEEVTLPLEPEKINRLLGTDISTDDMKEYLRRLEIPVDGMTIHVPSFRPDLRMCADIAEEVGRLYGFNTVSYTHLAYHEHIAFLCAARATHFCRIIVMFRPRHIGIAIRIAAGGAGVGRIPFRRAGRLRYRIQIPVGEDLAVPQGGRVAAVAWRRPVFFACEDVYKRQIYNSALYVTAPSTLTCTWVSGGI